ncbi:MAG: biotin--[Oscillospiraceae bacterium]|nr:biotin--[acetyl-CoA-carboxylase] ligase [Oscillospiraceae bacterium]
QTAGKGRMGRSFYSPAGSGLYMSVLLQPMLKAADAVNITACAAVAVAEAIESLAPVQAQIKWVNDVYVEGRKVCGILTEASLDSGTAAVNYLVVGIGINIRPPEGGFPADLQKIAGSVFGEEEIPGLRCRLAAAVLDRLLGYYEHLQEKPWLEEYRKRSLVTGKEIRVLMPGKEPENGTAIGIGDDFSLLVQMEDGTLRRLNSGEVSIRV